MKSSSILHILLSCAFLILSSCGGGTSGSGLKNFQGAISSTLGKKLSDVRVTIESTGDSTQTDQNGIFSLDSDPEGSEIPFLIESKKFRSTFSMKNQTPENAHVFLDITVNTVTDQVEVTNIALRAKIAGVCDYYFENGATIRQSNRVPHGTICSIEVSVLGDGEPLGDIPVALQYSSCEPNAPWHTVTEIHTGVGAFRGSGEINFEYKESETFCRYRVAAPYNPSDYSPVYYPIDTFAEQERVHPLNKDRRKE